MESKLKKRVIIDRRELISDALRQSMQYKISLSLHMYDPYEELKVVGIVNNVSTLHGRFRVDDDWFNIDDIEDIVVEDTNKIS